MADASPPLTTPHVLIPPTFVGGALGRERIIPSLQQECRLHWPPTSFPSLLAIVGRSAEISRLQGELRLQLVSPEVAQAAACFQQALAVARRQQTKTFELRAALSLGRLWQQQGQRQTTRVLLAPIYAWFTKGFDTPDLQDARTLLEIL